MLGVGASLRGAGIAFTTALLPGPAACIRHVSGAYSPGNHVPRRVVQYVRRTRSSVVLEDASLSELYRQDPYVQSQFRWHSMLKW